MGRGIAAEVRRDSNSIKKETSPSPTQTAALRRDLDNVWEACKELKLFDLAWSAHQLWGKLVLLTQQVVADAKLLLLSCRPSIGHLSTTALTWCRATCDSMIWFYLSLEVYLMSVLACIAHACLSTYVRNRQVVPDIVDIYTKQCHMQLYLTYVRVH